MNKFKKFFIGFSALLLLSSATVPICFFASKKHNINNKIELPNPVTKPILSIDDDFDINDPKCIELLHKYFNDEFFYKTNPNKIEYYNTKYKLKNTITSTLDNLFIDLIHSEVFSSLNNINDPNEIKNRFELLTEKSLGYFHEYLSLQIDWDKNFVSTLTDDNVSFELFTVINDEFYNMFDKSILIKKYSSSLSNLLQNNEKLKWLFNKTNSNDDYQKNYYINITVNNEYTSNVENYKEYQHFIYINYVNESNSFCLDYSSINGQAIRDEYSFRNFNFEEALNYLKNFTLNSFNSSEVKKTIVNTYLIGFGIEDNLDSNHIDKYYNDINQKLIDENITNFLIFMGINISNLEQISSIKDIFNIINSLYRNKYYLFAHFFYLSLQKNILTKNSTSYFLSNKKLLSSTIELIKTILIKDWDNILTAFQKFILAIGGNNQIFTIKGFMAKFYKSRILNIADSISLFINDINAYLSICIDKNLLEFDWLLSLLPGIDMDAINSSINTFAKTIVNELSSIKQIIDKITIIIKKVFDHLWWFSSIWPGAELLYCVISALIYGPDYDGSFLKIPFDITLNFLITRIMNIILSPFTGVSELINFCKENDISFYHWISTHWDKCSEGLNWIFAIVIKLDFLNWFHSCIPQLIKEID